MEKFEVLISEEQIKQRLKELGKEIKEFYNDEEIYAVCVLKGASIFYADLVRELSDLDVRFDFLACSSYGESTESSGVVKLTKDLDESVEGRNVLLIEDIVDTGYTLSYISKILKDRNPKSFSICTLLDKPSRRKVDVDVRFNGFEIEDKFVIGYGFDWNQKYRQLPYISVVR